MVDRSLTKATRRSIDRGSVLVATAASLVERSRGENFTVQEVADESGQSLRTLYQYFESKDDLLLAVFEEAMAGYAVAINRAITPLDDPLERLAAALMVAAQMRDRAPAGLSAGLARLRLRLGSFDPELVARSQWPVTELFIGLVDDAVASGALPADGPEGSVFMTLAVNSALIISGTLGNDYGVPLPDPIGLAHFCLEGLGARQDPGWYASLSQKLATRGSGAPKAPRRRSSGSTRSR